MKRKVVMIIEPAGDHYKARFPDYHAMGDIQANDAATLLRTGVEAIEAEAERRKTHGAGMKPPSTVAAHVFGGTAGLVGTMLTVIEADF